MTPVDLANLPPVMDVPAAAKVVPCSQYMLRKLIKDGTLPHLSLGRLVRVRRCDLLAWIDGTSS